MIKNIIKLKNIYIGYLPFIVPPITVLSFVESLKNKHNKKKILKNTFYGFIIATAYPISLPFYFIKYLF